MYKCKMDKLLFSPINLFMAATSSQQFICMPCVLYMVYIGYTRMYFLCMVANFLSQFSCLLLSSNQCSERKSLTNKTKSCQQFVFVCKDTFAILLPLMFLAKNCKPAETLSSFKSNLKPHLFKFAFNDRNIIGFIPDYDHSQRFDI